MGCECIYVARSYEPVIQACQNTRVCMCIGSSGRLDRKIELPLPDEKARGRIMQIHSRKMNVDKDGAYHASMRTSERMVVTR